MDLYYNGEKIHDIVYNAEGLNLKDIGYDYAVPDKFKEGMDYAKEIQEGWDSSSNSLNRMFMEDTKLVFMPMVDTSIVAHMHYCFSGCYSLISIPELDTSKVTGMSSCFSGCSSLISIPELDTSKVTDMSSCFSGCSSLISIPELDLGNVTKMGGCFSNCKSLTSIPKLDTSKVTEMSNCFQNCKSLTSIPKLDLGNVTSIYYFFNGCSKLTIVSELNTEKVTTVTACFYYCSNLKRVEGLSFKSMGSISSYINFLFGFSSNSSCRYLLIKDIGTNSACTTLDCTYARVWGIADDEVTDARQSLIDSLLTYSFDRRTAGYSDCTITLYADVKAVLTEDEITQIQAKGYIIS